MPEANHFYACPGGEHCAEGRDHPGRWFVCQYGRDDNVCETFEHEGRSARENAERIAGALNVVNRLTAVLDGEEWDSETMGEVGNIMHEEGFQMREPQAYGGWDHDGGPDTQEPGTNGN